MLSCKDILSPAIERSYGHLPPEALFHWATHEANLSEDFNAGRIKGTSAEEQTKKRKKEMLERIEQAFHDRGSLAMRADFITYYRDMFLSRLEDPGLLHNFEYFDIPSSDYMLMFYLSMWTSRMADAMIYLHNYGWNLKGEFKKIPKDDVWYHMSKFEAMNIGEREKAKSVANWSYRIGTLPKITFFGGGNLPERFYGLQHSDITVFDAGIVRPISELFADNDWQRLHTTFYKENLLQAPAHQELQGTQNLVVMHGVSMYLGPILTVKALKIGCDLLAKNGIMMFDYLIMTESMRRCLVTQGWPKTEKEMDIFANPGDAIKRGIETLEKVNALLEGKAYFDAIETNTRLVDPWGATNVRFVLKKYA